MENIIEVFRSFYENASTMQIAFDVIFIGLIILMFVTMVWLDRKTLRYIALIVGSFILYIIVTTLNLPITKHIFELAAPYWLMVVVLLLFNELRLMLERFDLKSNRRSTELLSGHFARTLIKAVETLSKEKVGALITIENDQSMEDYISKAIEMDALITVELIEGIFNSESPTHDGAVIIKDGRIACCGAYYPMSLSDQVNKSMGSRHRAAIGISEAFDCLTIVVSEETGRISIAHDGVLERNLDQEDLQNYLEQYIDN